MTENVLITGVSTGIGRDAARMLIERGIHVFGSVRKPQDADELRSAFGDGITPLQFDVTNPAEIDAARAVVQDRVRGQGLSGLVNNAGIGRPGPIQHVSMESFRQLFDVNFFGLVQVTKTFLPLLGARKDCPHPAGRILNISSISGRVAYPFQGPYAASKHALEGFSDSLRRELALYGIKVIVIQPGPIHTPNWGKALPEAHSYLESDYGPYLEGFRKHVKGSILASALPVERVTRVIERALFAPKPKPRYVVTPRFLMSWFYRDSCLTSGWTTAS